MTDGPGEPVAPDVAGNAAVAFGWLPGDWKLDRTISDGGTVLGKARFAALKPRVLHYLETGMLRLDSGYLGEIRREYYYVLEEGYIHVTFADAAPGERTFLRLRPIGDRDGCLRAQGNHHCDRDLYTATYDFESARRVVVTMRVSGRHKDYSIATVLTRD
jgi:hypothetical protein